jgi:hypothetical protein
MKKLKLDLLELDVQSFPTTESTAGADGTVHGMIVSTDQPDCMGGSGVHYCLPSIYGNLGIDPAFGTLAGLGVDPAENSPEAFHPGRIQDFQGDGA